jgi:hypothetical protein
MFGRKIVPPRELRASLAAIFGASSARLIEEVSIIERSLFARLHGRVIATTRRRRIFLRGSAAEFFGDPSLMLHEYCHVLNQWETGSLTTLRYLGEWLRRGYWNNRFEIEARAFAREHDARLRDLLGTLPGAQTRAPRVNLGSPAPPDAKR